MGIGLAIASIASAAYGAYTTKKSSDESKKQNKEAQEALDLADANAQKAIDESLVAQGGGSSSQLQLGQRSVYSSLLGG